MIKIKVVDLLNVEPILIKIKQDAEINGLNLNLSYKLKRLFDKLNLEYADIHEQKNKIFNKFGEKYIDENQKEMIRIPAEKVTVFNKYWEELLNIDIELFNVFKFTAEELKLTEKYTLQEAAFLEPFLESPILEVEPERSKINIEFDDETEIKENEPVGIEQEN